MAVFFCRLVPPRATFVQDMTPAEAAAMGRHAAYWRSLIGQGTRVFALGLVVAAEGAFGVGIVDVDDEAALSALTGNDPAVKAGIGMHYEIHPMPRGVMHSAS